MKKISLVIALMTAFFVAGAQTQGITEDVLQIKEMEHDFGKIPLSDTVCLRHSLGDLVSLGHEKLKILPIKFQN